MSSRFVGCYKEKSTRKCDNPSTSHSKNSTKYAVETKNTSKGDDCVKTKRQICGASAVNPPQCSGLSKNAKDYMNKHKEHTIKPQKDKINSQNCLYRGKSSENHKNQNRNKRKRICNKVGNNSTNKTSEKLEALQRKVQKKKRWSRRQKKQKKNLEMASPCAKALKKDTGSVTFNCNYPAEKSSHNQQNNHRKCSARSEDHPMRDDTYTQANIPELPGFYYDKEKKKYFKILPSSSGIGNAVTTAAIKTKEKEQTRKSDLLMKSKESILGRRQYLSTHCIPCLTCQIQQGGFSPRALDHTLNKLRLRNMNKTPQTRIKIYSDSRQDWLERLEHASQLEMIENKRIVGLFSIKESMIQRILWLKLTDKPIASQKDRLSLSIDPSPSCRYYQSAVKIASMRLIDKDSVLYTGMVYTGTPESLVFIKGLGESSSRYEVYSLGQKATWSCAWNKHANQFSVGSEKCGMLLDVQTRRLWQINTNNSDVLCQEFSKQDGHCLYSGTRKNQIFTHDLRSISTYSVSHLTQTSSVCGLHLLDNDIHLLASDVKGKVNLWDLRNKRVVTEYLGTKNEYLRIPIHVDQSEEVVYGVDQDGYTRLWCLQTGELLKTIPPPMATSYDFFPSVLYSKTWNDKPGNAGLLMGLGDKIYVYSDYQEDE